jgi:peroxidase
MARARACGLLLLLRGAALVTVVAVLLGGMVGEARAQLRQNYYGSSCPSAESTVRSVISQRLQQSFAVGPGTLRLFFHDCFVRVRQLGALPLGPCLFLSLSLTELLHAFVPWGNCIILQGCDASVMLMAPNGDDESHSGADATLSPDAVDAINKAKAAVEALPGCAGKVSCADILAMAARDVVSLVNLPSFLCSLAWLFLVAPLCAPPRHQPASHSSYRSHHVT